MPNTTTRNTCMNCGTPIDSGFFCRKCEQSGEAQTASGRPAGSRFTGSTGKKKKREMLMDDLLRWTWRLVALAVIVGGGYFAWQQWGDNIMSSINRTDEFVNQERYDPTQDAAVSETPAGEDEVPGTGRRPLSQTKLNDSDPQ